MIVKSTSRIIREDWRLFSIITEYPWSFFALVRTHNPEVVGSSPSPATSKKPPVEGGFCVTYRLKFNTEMAQNLQADVCLMFVGMLSG